MILIIDIDETLVHSVKKISKQSLIEDKELDPGDVFTVFEYTVQKRPGLDAFLSSILNDDYYDVGIWSAGSFDYVHAIVNHIIPDKKNLRFIMTANDCNEMRDKPLTKVRQILEKESNDHLLSRTVHDFLIIDDRDGVTGHNELNHLKILEFEGDTDDEELSRLWTFLDKNRYYSSEYLTVHWN